MTARAYHFSGGVSPDSYMYSNYFEEMDGNSKDIRLIDATPDGGALIMPKWMHVGRPILPDHVPTKLNRGGPGIKRQPLLDYNSWISSVPLVTQSFKDILEELEPGVHQFFPMTYFQNKTERIGEGYLFIFGQRLDTLHDTACWPGRDARGFPMRPPKGEEIRVVFSAEKIGTHHAWVDKFAEGRRISGEFARRLMSLNQTGLHLKPLLVE